MGQIETLGTNTVVAGKFRIVGRLGAGGMGVVYVAEHVDLGQKVAIKVIGAGEHNAELIQRFRREALVMAKLDNDNVVRVLDYGTLDDGSPYLVMELLKGLDLGAYIAKQGPMSVSETAEVGVAVCAALADAHAKGIVHRDLKPSNLFLVERPGGRHVVKLLDFGISLFREAGVAPITATSAGVGTPLYAAPELFTSPRGADARADIWSLGATLYELATGRVPFPAATLGELAQMLRRPPPKASTIGRDIGEPFSDLLAACLQRDPANRIASAVEVGRALQQFRALNQSSLLFGGQLDENLRRAFDVNRDTPLQSLAHRSTELAVAAPLTATVPLVAREATRPKQSRTGIVLALVAAMVCASALLGFYVLQRLPPRTSPLSTEIAPSRASTAASVVSEIPTSDPTLLPLQSAAPRSSAARPLPTADGADLGIPSRSHEQRPRTPSASIRSATSRCSPNGKDEWEGRG